MIFSLSGRKPWGLQFFKGPNLLWINTLPRTVGSGTCLEPQGPRGLSGGSPWIDMARIFGIPSVSLGQILCFSMFFPSIPTGILMDLWWFVCVGCLNGCEIPSQEKSVQPSIWSHRQLASGLLNPGISGPTCLKLSQFCRLIFNR